MKRYIFIVIILLLSFFSVYAVTPRASGENHWDIDEVRCYVDYNIYSTYGSTVYSAVQDGTMAWNSTDAPSVIQDYTGSVWDVMVTMHDYGETSWDGLCSTQHDTLTGINDFATISLNSHYIPNATLTNTTKSGLWKAIACHEIGHAHGLGHNVTNGELSIMKEVTTQYYDYINLTLMISTPRTADITTINSIY